jgi:hypothetical protein
MCSFDNMAGADGDLNQAHRRWQLTAVARPRNQNITQDQRLQSRAKRSAFVVCSLHQRHINTTPEKPRQHA